MNLTIKELAFLASIAETAVNRDGMGYNKEDIIGHEIYTSEIYTYASSLHKAQFSKSSVPALCKSLLEKGAVVLTKDSDGEIISMTATGANELNFYKN